MPLAYSLTTRIKVKLLIGETGSTYDSLIDQLIDAATDQIEDYCGNRRFVADTYNGTSYDGTAVAKTEYYDGNQFGMVNKKTIQLRSWPVIEVVSVSYASGDLNNQTWNLYDPKTQYMVDPVGQIRFFGPLPQGYQNIKVVYKAGYLGGNNSQDHTTRSLPESLDQACQKLVAREFNRRKSQGILKEMLDKASIDWSQDLPADVKDVLSSFKRLSF